MVRQHQNEFGDNETTRRRFIRTTGVVAGATSLGIAATGTASAGKTTVNGWYEEEEIYYIDNGVEEGVTERGENDIYLIGGNRVYQAQVVEFIPGEPGYTPHWNVHVVHTASGKTTGDIASSQYASNRFNDMTNEGPLFDDLADIMGAELAGLVTIDEPGIVVNCPIISEQAAEAPGHDQASENFPPFPSTF